MSTRMCIRKTMLNKIQSNTYSHMPFLTKDVVGEDVLFLCIAPSELNRFGNRTWKIHYIDSIHATPMRIDTKMSVDTFECSPTGWYDENGWHVSFIAGGDPKSPRFKLFMMEGPSLETLGDPVVVQQSARSGFISKNSTVYSRKTVDYEQIVGLSEELRFDLSEILRVSYQADNLDKILISYKKDELYTIRYDINTKAIERILCDGQPAYKFTMYGDTIIYAQIIDNGFENRKLKVAENIVFSPLSAFP